MIELEINDNMFYYTNDGFNVYLGHNETEHKFGVLAEITDSRDYEDEPDQDYPFVVSFGIIADSPNKRFNEGEDDSQAGMIEQCNGYMGNIPIDHILLHSISLQGDAFGEVKDKFSIDEAKVHSVKSDFGTFAAQNGRGTEFKYLMFRDEKTAKNFIDLMVDRMKALRMMIGFILDMPINMAGESGWSTFERMVSDK